MRLIALLSICFTLSCGYTFQGAGSTLPPSIKTVYIDNVVNNTTKTGLGYTLTEALKDRFDRYGTITVLDNDLQADSVLKTEIVSVDEETRSVTSGTDNALQLETIMTVYSELRSATGQLLWKEKSLKVSKVFGTSQDSVVTSSAAFSSSGLNQSDLNSLDSREISRGQEAEVLEEMTEKIAKKVYESAVLPEF